MIRRFFLLATLATAFLAGKSQTTLAPGDIAFLGIQSSNTPAPPGERFAFVLLKAVDNGTAINFSDNQFVSPAFCSGDHVTWTNTTGGTLPILTVIELRGTNTTTPVVFPSTLGSVARTGSFDFEPNEVIYAYQGSSAPYTFLAEIANPVSNMWGNCNNCGMGSPSCLAPTLTEGVNALKIINPPGMVTNSNGFYNGPLMTGSIDELRALLNDANNWSVSGSPQTWPSFSLVLPVKFISFTAIKVNETARLTWKVADEENVLSYEVERSSDGASFTKVGEVPAKGFSTYTFTDDKILPGVNFYRVRNLDVDGRFAYTHVVSINNKDLISLKLFPVPARSQIFVQHNPAGKYADLKILSMDGRLLQVQKVPEGSVQTTIDLQNFRAGIYFVSFRSGNGEELKEKFIKQ